MLDIEVSRVIDESHSRTLLTHSFKSQSHSLERYRLLTPVSFLYGTHVKVISSYIGIIVRNRYYMCKSIRQSNHGYIYQESLAHAFVVIFDQQRIPQVPRFSLYHSIKKTSLLHRRQNSWLRIYSFRMMKSL